MGKKIRLNSEYNKKKYRFIAKQQGGGSGWKITKEASRLGGFLLDGLNTSLAKGGPES